VLEPVGLRALRTLRYGRQPRADDFDYMPHVTQTTWSGISADIVAGVEELRAPEGDRPAPTSIFTIGFCMGGRMSYLAATLGLDLAGVIGMYGTLAGPWRNDAPQPIESTSQFGSPVLGLFGGADTVITPEQITAFDAALSAASVDHRLVTYPGAPHSFFDRKAAEFAEASAGAWSEVVAFITARTAPSETPASAQR